MDIRLIITGSLGVLNTEYGVTGLGFEAGGFGGYAVFIMGFMVIYVWGCGVYLLL